MWNLCPKQKRQGNFHVTGTSGQLSLFQHPPKKTNWTDSTLHRHESISTLWEVLFSILFVCIFEEIKLKSSRRQAVALVLHSYTVCLSISISALQVWALAPLNARPANWQMRDPLWKHHTSCDWPITGSGLTADYMLCTCTFQRLQGCLSGCFQLSPFWGRHSAIWTNTVQTFWPMCSFARWHMITSKFNIQLIWGVWRHAAA